MENQWNKFKVWYYPNPDCPHCRASGNLKIFHLIALIILGAYLIYTIQDDVESQCCKAYKIMSDEIAKRNVDVAKEIKSSKDLPSANPYLTSIMKQKLNITDN